MILAELPTGDVEAPLFTTALTVGEAQAEWVRATGLAPVAKTGMRIFGGARGDAPERLFADVTGRGLLTRAGSILGVVGVDDPVQEADRKSTRLNSSHVSSSYAVFCLKKKE